MRVKAYLLAEKEYLSRGSCSLKIIRFKISFYTNCSFVGILNLNEETEKYQIVLRREGEEGGVGTILVFNSLLYKTTPIKKMGDDYVLITIPSAEGKMDSYLFKPLKETVSHLQEEIEKIIQSIE